MMGLAFVVLVVVALAAVAGLVVFLVYTLARKPRS